MLAFWGIIIIAGFMFCVLTQRVSPFVGLVLIPVGIALVAGFVLPHFGVPAGFDASKLGKFMGEGLRDVSPTAALMILAVLFFSILTDTGVFDPIIRGIVVLTRGDPMRVVIGTAVLALVASLEGEGAVTVVITCTPLLPIYKQLKIRLSILAVLAWFPVAIKSFLPWAGPSARAVAALHIEPGALFYGLAPCIAAGTAWILATAVFYGARERKLLGSSSIDPAMLASFTSLIIDKNAAAKRPHLIWVNLGLMLAVLAAVFVSTFVPATRENPPMSIIFAIGSALALAINYRSVQEQTDRIFAHSRSLLTVGIMIIASSVFVGILSRTGMVDAMAHLMTDHVPPAWGGQLALITALISGPASFALSPDGFFFGFLPVLSSAAGTYGLPPTAIGVAGLMGSAWQVIGPTVGALWLLLGMSEVSLPEFHKAAFPPYTALILICILTAIMTGGLPSR